MKIKSTRSFTLLVTTSFVVLTSSLLRASETDDRIESSAGKSYVFKTYLKDDSVKTESKDGVVTLTGTVAEPFHKVLAQDTVEGLPGVKSVDNQIGIKGDTPVENSDTWLVMKVKNTLFFHRNVSAVSTHVKADHGIVHLYGEASSMAQKDLTTEYAADIEGVKAVKNEMTVAEAAPQRTIMEKIDDASISAQIKSSLLFHRSTSALKTKIRTIDGVVSVNGKARNAAEKRLVSRIVSDIHGVNRVHNNMTIKTATASNH